MLSYVYRYGDIVKKSLIAGAVLVGLVGAARDQLPPMLRSLLADRFKLAFHRETKDLAIYALVAAKNGPKFHALQACAGRPPGKLNHMRPKDLPLLSQVSDTFSCRQTGDR
jgi:uncharacterized protein (TIGR03435 family)